ncbi:plant cysteine oxidase 2-like isoform X2 [Mangifera indica]|uniref:plant cysteine oxidase 2-like isoform X2 n=1 Tax=Mangifera indica TaxID=29780 RepID=UPI001CF9E123|nr:plant cysteine oxidase 2-like isoform X2 [Mangifera indica]
MGIGTTLVDLKGKELSELPSVADNSKNNSNTHSNSVASTTKNNNSKKNRRRQKKMLPVQKLYDTCKDVFAFGGPGIVPSPEKIERLRSVLDDIKPEDVGLNPDKPYVGKSVARRTPAITYLHLHECDKFSMGIFCLPPNGVIPLHNHPGMTVFSKLLFGTMHIKSYDWVDDVPCNTSSITNPSEIQHAGVQLAKVKVDSDFTAPCNTSILYPADGGNMHCFTAVTACAVLDVLGPPYSDVDGRHCTYYLDIPFTEFSADGVSMPEEEKQGYALLQEREKPEDLVVDGAPYRGPVIVKK